MSGHITRAVIVLTVVGLATLLFSRVATLRNSPYYKAHDNLRKVVHGVEADVGGCKVHDGGFRGSGNPPFWLDCESHSDFRVQGTPQQVAAFLLALKTAFMQAGSSTQAKVTLEKEQTLDKGTSASFVLKFATPSTQGRVTVNLTQEGRVSGDSRIYELQTKIEEWGW
jgi:hypothetical protein